MGSSGKVLRRLSAENEGESTRTEGASKTREAESGSREGSALRRRTDDQSEGYFNKESIEG